MPESVRAVCPGSFDPITRGHLDIIERAHSVFHEVVVAVGRNTTKNYLFDIDERLDLVRRAVGHLDGVTVEIIDGLLSDFCKEHQASVIVKGVRFGTDLDYELQMGQLNRFLSGIETVLLPAGREYGTISSSMLREVAANHGDISPFVTAEANAAVRAKLGY
ncbi:pantetheine-phosphate adenylyltransferase [Propionibacterium sp.]|uniref:pantetheine-phosphate adenylyltransferase n=1 Tax=Propionibacterium sp. TaxID=1977903 RepID=UPI0039EBAC28